MFQLEKVAVFLILVGQEKGRRILALLDDDEIKRIILKLREVSVITEQMQQSVWREFYSLGYEEGMKAADIVNILRFSAGGKLHE